MIMKSLNHTEQEVPRLCPREEKPNLKNELK